MNELRGLLGFIWYAVADVAIPLLVVAVIAINGRRWWQGVQR